jgi:site-specific DNA-adenine methylase
MMPSSCESYFEPFLGGGAVYFYLASTEAMTWERAFLSDINKDLIRAYRTVRDFPNGAIDVLSKADFERCHHVMSECLTIILQRPWQEAMKAARSGDVVYLDPPYLGGFVSYAGEWGQSENDELLEAMAKSPAHVVCSMPDIPEVTIKARALGLRFKQIVASRSISANGNREPKGEVLICNKEYIWK